MFRFFGVFMHMPHLWLIRLAETRLRQAVALAILVPCLGNLKVVGDPNLAGETAMANPPQVSLVGPLGNVPSIPSGRVLVDRTNPAFRFSGARVGQWDDTYPHNLFNVASGITGTYASIPFVTEFETDATEMSVFTFGTGGKYRIRVDREYVGLEPASGPPPDGNFYLIKISFATPRRRAIAIEGLGIAFGGLIIAGADHVYPPTLPLGPRCIVLGDSFTEGLTSYAQRLSGLMGWEVWSSGVGGTGYLNPGLAGRVKFRDRVQSDVIANHPDIVIIAGGINDGASANGALKSEAQALYDILLTQLSPGAKVVVVGPWWPRGIPSQEVLDTRDALRDAAVGRGLAFIDSIISTDVTQINVGWIKGTGNAGNPQGNGNADTYISQDGTHPTDLGHQYLARRLSDELKASPYSDPRPRLEIVVERSNLAGEVLAANPPKVSLVGPIDGKPLIPPGRLMVERTNDVFRFSGAQVQQWDESYPHNLFLVSSGITGAYAQLPFKTEFETDASQMEILTLGTGGQYRLKIDGEYAGLDVAAGPSNDGQFYWLKVVFSDARRRAVSLEGLGFAFGGVVIGNDDHIFGSTRPKGPRCIVLGDSFTEGLACYAQRLSGHLGWEVWSSGVADTGYLNSGASGRVKFRDRVVADVVANRPDIIIIAGGMTDLLYPADALKAEAKLLYDTILSQLPSATVVVVGPWWPRADRPQYLLDARDAIRDAALSRGLSFVDPILAAKTSQTDLGWLRGVASGGNPQGKGNLDLYISSNTSYPTDQGHQYLALRLANQLKTIFAIKPAPSAPQVFIPRLLVHGEVGRSYLLQSRTQTTGSEWVDLDVVPLPSSPHFWEDKSSTEPISKFYRAVLLR